nr:cytochrome P450 [Tanacetum cinerariifolium]
MLCILLFIVSFLYIFTTQWRNRKSGNSARLPPGPYLVPIIGSIFKLGKKPHHSLAALSKTYGPLMSLNLGSTTTIVVSSREVVQELFSKHDISLSSRSILYAAYSYTQNLKKKLYGLVASELFKDLVCALMEVGGTPNLADFIPVLRPLDPHRLLKRANLITEKLMAIFEKHIDNRLEARAKRSSDAPSTTNDLTDLLLDFSQDEKSSITLDDMRVLLFDLFTAGTDTTSSTFEWAMAELISNPEKNVKSPIRA